MRTPRGDETSGLLQDALPRSIFNASFAVNPFPSPIASGLGNCRDEYQGVAHAYCSQRQPARRALSNRYPGLFNAPVA